jgi:hypothetical protein
MDCSDDYCKDQNTNGNLCDSCNDQYHNINHENANYEDTNHFSYRSYDGYSAHADAIQLAQLRQKNALVEEKRVKETLEYHFNNMKINIIEKKTNKYKKN